jgi:uncharacterized metal-binding protein YceD (DUF177 family)
MKEPLYRWVCTMCGISDSAESGEMARLNIDLHVQVMHPSARRTVRVRPDPDGEQDEEAARGPAEEEDNPGSRP